MARLGKYAGPIFIATMAGGTALVVVLILWADSLR